MPAQCISERQERQAKMHLEDRVGNWSLVCASDRIIPQAD